MLTDTLKNSATKSYQLNRGDFIQLSSWNENEWSEILHVYGDPLNNVNQQWQVFYCRYSDDGTKRWVGVTSDDDTIRKHITKVDIERGSNEIWRCKIMGVICAADEFYGLWQGVRIYKKWSTKLFYHKGQSLEQVELNQ